MSISVLVLASAAMLLSSSIAPRWKRPTCDISQNIADEILQLKDLLQKSSNQLAIVDIAILNLVCAEQLPGAQELDLGKAQSTLDEWAHHVRMETERYLPQYHHNPEDYNHSEAYFRVLTMVTVLQQDYRVRYNPGKMTSAADPQPNDAFFADSQDLFLHGILGPRRMGTCVSMPVLYVAVGRRLGYPLKLATTKGHVFARWEDTRETFNIEGTNEGLNCFPDEYYRHWPFHLTHEELQSRRYMRSLSSAEELALFLQTRGMCLKASGRLAEAKVAWEKARELAPGWEENSKLISSVAHQN